VGPIVVDVNPVIIQLGHFSLRWYGLFVGLAIITAFLIARREGMRRGISEDAIFSVGTWGVLGGVIGARLLHVVDHWAGYAANPASILAIQDGGLAIYGGIMGGIAAGAIGAHRQGLPVLRVADVAAPALVLAQAIGRIGCLFNGDALGSPTSLPWGVAYVNPGAMAPSLGVAYHPTPAYEMLGDLLIFALLWKLRGRIRRDGIIFLTYLALYSTLKFTVSFARQEAIFLAGLQEAQVFSLAGGLIAVTALIWLVARRPAQRKGMAER
jgi:phosphatidylglycerol---prolipoprotein diacylglyceryl transferase